MRNNDQTTIKSFFNNKSKLSTSKTHSETERSSHKSNLFASPPFKVTPHSNISSILNQITTAKAIYRPLNLISERKNSPITSGYMNLAPEIQQKMVMKGKDLRDCKEFRDSNCEKKDIGFMQDIEKCLEYFETNHNENESRRESYETIQRKKMKGEERRKYCNSLHEFGKMKIAKDESETKKKDEEWLRESRRKEKILINEINCHKAKENEYIKKIGYYEGKMNKMLNLLKVRKAKVKDLKCAYLKEEIMKENAMGLIRNILEK